MALKIDTYDRKMLGYLDQDARQSISELAKKVKLTKETTHYRLKRLEDNGIIREYNMVINASMLGFRYFKVFVKFLSMKPEKERELIQYLQKKRICSNLRLTNGSYDLVFLAIFISTRNFEDFMSEFTEQYGSYFSKKSLHVVTRSYRFYNKILSKEVLHRQTLDHTVRRFERLDSVDLLLLKGLLRNPRAKLTELNKQTKVPTRVLAYRLKKLESKNIIVGYSVSINMDNFIVECIQINISLVHNSDTSKVIEFFMKNAVCVLAYKLLGEFDLSLEIYVTSDLEFRNLINEFRVVFYHKFHYYETLRVFRDYATNWAPLDKARNEE